MKKKFILYILSGSGMLAILISIVVYKCLFGMSIVPENKKQDIFISTGAEYKQVIDTLESNLKINSPKLLDWVAKKMNYPQLIRPGRYIIDKAYSYTGLVNLLRSGRQTPVKVTFNNIRTLNELAGKLGRQIEADSSVIITYLTNSDNLQSAGFTRENVISVFIPDTYEFWWNTSAGSFFSRMVKEYRSFWNDERLAKAKEKGLDPLQVAILASIIDDEVARPDEKPRIAGVYLNRLKRGMPLQACPTIKFALNDFSITRVLKKYLNVDSPYNTYIHAGFPPGPIGCPTIEGIESVLNAEKHDYLFFAARADFSGYHNFSRTLAEHNHYAAIYQAGLNKRKIFK